MSTSDHLSHIESTGLIQLAQLEPELEYIFRHALIQDAAYGMLVKEQRRSVHAAVANAIELLYPDRLTELSPQLAYHFDEAGELEKALSYSTIAAEQAASRYANTEASMHYARAIDLAGQLQAERNVLIKLYEGQGRILQLNGKHEDALTTYLGLELVARERGDRALELHALMEQSTVYAMLTEHADPQESIRLSEKALAIAREIGDEAAEAKILWNISLAHWHNRTNMVDAIKFGEQSLEIARRLNLQEQLAFTLHDLGRYYALANQYQRGTACQQEAESLWRELGNRPMLADSLSLKATLLYSGRNYEGAKAASVEALTISQEIGNLWGQAMSFQGQSQMAFDEGEIAQALEFSKNAASAADQAGFMLGMFTSRGRVTEIYDYVAQTERMIEAQLDLERLAEQYKEPLLQGPLMLWHAIKAFRNGDPAPARKLLEVSKTWPRPPNSNIATFFDLRRAELAHMIGDHESVLAIVEPIELVTSGLQLSVSALSQIVRLQGQSLVALGRLSEARAVFEKANELVSHKLVHFQRWELFAAIAELDELEGNIDAAQTHRAQAREEIEYIAKRIGDPEMEATFRARVDVAALLASG
jgi:tetratricopeptide (TPR) repeat protein